MDPLRELLDFAYPILKTQCSITPDALNKMPHDVQKTIYEEVKRHINECSGASRKRLKIVVAQAQRHIVRIK